MERSLVTMLGFTLIVALFKPTVAMTLQRVDQNISIHQIPGACTAEELQAKDVDVALFGATGTLGTIFAEYLASRPGMVPWAMVGRDRETISTVKQRIGAHNAKIIEADYEQMNSLHALAKRAKVVLNTAGPFERNGAEALIKAAIDNCAHYIDVAGETHWRADMIKKFGPKAETRGVIMTQGAGYVSLAADWLALSAARDVAKDGQGPPKDVFITFTKMNGAPGGGSLASAQYAWEKYGPVADPYILSPETPVEAQIDKEIDGIDTFGFHPGVDLKLAVYAGARMDCPLARRSIQTEFPGVPIKVHGAQTEDLMNDLKAFLSDPKIISDPPPFMPGTHTGPPKWIQEQGGFAAEAWSLRKKDGHAARVKLSGRGDPAFKGSARMTGELAIGLAINGPFKGRVGYLSPAQVVDTEELERLMKAVDGGQWVTISHVFEQVKNKPRNSAFESSDQLPQYQPQA